jgi:drug/metabolite transporter (DMT)-like permease
MVATAACLGTLICWSLGPIFITYLAGYVDPYTQNALRYTVACLFWLPVLMHFSHKGRVDGLTWRRAIVPALANVTMQSLWAVAFYYLGPAFAVLLNKTSLLWVAAFSLIVFPEERPLLRSKRFWWGLILSVAGVVGVLAFKDDFTTTGTRTGVVIALVCAFAWAAYIIAAKIAFARIDSRVGFAVTSLYTTVCLWIGVVAFGSPAEAMRMPAGPWGAVVASGITAIALGHVFYYTAIKRLGATIPVLVILSQPLLVFAISSIAFNERLNGLQVVFGGVLIVGAALAVWAQEHLNRGPKGR